MRVPLDVSVSTFGFQWGGARVNGVNFTPATLNIPRIGIAHFEGDSLFDSTVWQYDPETDSWWQTRPDREDTFVFTTPSGSFTLYSHSFWLLPGPADVWSISAGTGRFANATGTGTFSYAWGAFNPETYRTAVQITLTGTMGIR